MAFVAVGSARCRGGRRVWVCAVSDVPASSEERRTRGGSRTRLVDVAIVGGGPAGTSLAGALGEKGKTVVMVDRTLDRKWPNNYGVWMDEMKPIGLDDCMQKTWPVATVYTSADADKKHVMDRPYGRVDVRRLKKKLLQKCADSGRVDIIKGTATELEHDRDLSRLNIDAGEEAESGSVDARVVVDATGHALRFVKFTEGHSPGVQAAYGMEITVKSHPWPVDEMLLMDFRSEHMKGSAEERREANEIPLFFYVMPMSDTRIFVEETSLIGKPPVPFDYLKKQCYKRLAYHGVEVEEVHEEELCYIPMGGGMPLRNQRVVGFGGTAGLVHPATGYMVANTLRRAEETAQVIVDALDAPNSSGNAVAAAIWQKIWSPQRLLQRDFLVFGGEVILRMKLNELRSFFDAFFRLPFDQWSNFLSFGLLKPEERLLFGLGVFTRTSNPVRLRLMQEAILNGQLSLLNSVIPLPFRGRQ